MSTDWYYAGESAHGQLNATGTPFTFAEADAMDKERGKGIYYVAPSGGGGGGGGGGGPSPRPIDPWIRTSDYVAPQGIKQADPDLVLFKEEPIDPDFLIDRTFEQIGGTELLRISRSDLINGDNVVYTPIANLSYFRRQFNPNNIIALDSTLNSGFAEFSIDLMSRGVIDPYLDDSGNLIIEVDIIKKSENIETEISSSGTMNRIEL